MINGIYVQMVTEVALKRGGETGGVPRNRRAVRKEGGLGGFPSGIIR